MPLRLLLFAELDGLLKIPLLGCDPLLRQCPLALFDGLSQIILIAGPPIRRVAIQATALPVLVGIVVGFLIVASSAAYHPVSHARPGPPFLTKTTLIKQQASDILRLLAHIGTLVLALFIKVLEFLEGLDDVDVVAEIDDDVFGTLVKAVVKYSETLAIALAS